MRLFNAGFSPNALRVRAVANELGIELELVDVNLLDPKAKREMLLPWNPNAKVPVLVDGDFVLWESRAIIAYLASRRPEAGLYPADRKRREMGKTPNVVRWMERIEARPSWQKAVAPVRAFIAGGEP
jgi:glutathione S-transferase